MKRKVLLTTALLGVAAVVVGTVMKLVSDIDVFEDYGEFDDDYDDFDDEDLDEGPEQAAQQETAEEEAAPESDGGASESAGREVPIF